MQFSGVPATVSVAYPLVGQFIQVKLGSASRVVVNPGQVPGDLCVTASCALVIANSDTLLTSAGNGGYPQLSDNGVPFGYIDREPKNNFRYFYSVTAFDVNSFQSGPSSLESPRVAKSGHAKRHGVQRGGTAADFRSLWRRLARPGRQQRRSTSTRPLDGSTARRRPPTVCPVPLLR